MFVEAWDDLKELDKSTARLLISLVIEGRWLEKFS
jgi:hypothetical protein